MAGENMERKPEILVFAGPNGSGKSDIIHIYDNSQKPFRIYKNRKGKEFFWASNFWTEKQIKDLVL